MGLSSEKWRLACSRHLLSNCRVQGAMPGPEDVGQAAQTGSGLHNAVFQSVGQEDSRCPSRQLSERISDKARAVQEIKQVNRTEGGELP